MAEQTSTPGSAEDPMRHYALARIVNTLHQICLDQPCTARRMRADIAALHSQMRKAIDASRCGGDDLRATLGLLHAIGERLLEQATYTLKADPHVH